MKVTVVNNSRLSTLSNSITSGLAKLLQQELPVIRKDIIESTRAGISQDGSMFVPYSSSYKSRKRKISSFGVSPPNLSLTGDMLNSIVGKIDRDNNGVSATIEITGEFNRNKARWNQGGNPKIPARNFMGVQEKSIIRIINRIKTLIT